MSSKDSFKYQYNRPCSDWFETVDVEIKLNDYYYFKIERRFGPSWWIVGMNPVEKPEYHWEEKSLGEINERDLLRFIKWAESDNYRSKIIEIKAICGDFNILEEIKRLISMS